MAITVLIPQWQMCALGHRGIASVVPAHSFVHPPCEIRNFLVLMMGTGLMGEIRHQGRTAGSPTGTPSNGHVPGSCLDEV